MKIVRLYKLLSLNISETTTTTIRKKRGRPKKKRPSDEALEHLTCIYCSFIGISHDILDMHYHETHRYQSYITEALVRPRGHRLENRCVLTTGF